MKVTATARGYYGKLREPGDVFDVPTGSKATWFVPHKASRAAKPENDQPDEGDSKVEELT